ncbi:hypothetical protein [Archangium sp.]|uniref:hypothetical protein n=1 Tax=Archangium sp. TaxID=1872627 RepID=UPI00389A58F8
MFPPHREAPLRQEAKHGAQDPERHGGVKQEERLEDTVGGGRIRCPKCGWRPRKSDLWGCRCGCAWNTFDTGGKCPRCGIHWKNTQCFRCMQWSPHEDWYTPGTPGQGAAS